MKQASKILLIHFVNCMFEFVNGKFHKKTLTELVEGDAI